MGQGRMAPTQKWAYCGGDWLRPSPQTMTAPDNSASMNLAIATETAFVTDGLEVSFSFQWRNSYTTAGFVFASNSNASEFLVVDFPFTGGGPADPKTEMMWVTLSHVRTEVGWRETIASKLMSGVSSNPAVTHVVVIKVSGDAAHIEMDGRGAAQLPVPAAVMAAVGRSGWLGFATHNNLGTGHKTLFGDLAVHSEQDSHAAWQGPIALRAPFRVIDNALGPAGVGNIARLGDQWIMTNAATAPDVKAKQVGTYVLHSSTHGSWTVSDKPLPAAWTAQCPACSADDHGFSLVPDGSTLGPVSSVSAYFVSNRTIDTHGFSFAVSRASTTDGVHWGEPEIVWTHRFGPDLPFLSLTLNTVLRLRDGMLMMFLTGATNSTFESRDFGEGLKSWRVNGVPPFGRNFAVRSDTGGASFSSTISWLDGGPNTWACQLHKDGDEGQVSAVQLASGDVLALVRPDFQGSPWVWESRARAGSLTFGPMARGRFHMKASVHAILTTASGVTLIGGRFPQLSVQATWDDGVSWQLTSIDAAFEGYGAMAEVEKDLVLFVYGGLLCGPNTAAARCERQLRYQVLRVEHSPQRLSPASHAWAGL